MLTIEQALDEAYNNAKAMHILEMDLKKVLNSHNVGPC